MKDDRPITIISSFNVKDWGFYAEAFVNSFIEKWDSRINLSMYYHNGDLPKNHPVAKNVKYIPLDTDKQLSEFKETYKQHDGIDKENHTYNFRFDAVKFCHKVFAITNEAFSIFSQIQDGYLIWLDADSQTIEKVSLEDIQDIIVHPEKPDIIHLGRTAVNYSETSFVCYNINSLRTIEFLTDLRGLYLSGEVFGYREWHDGFLFSRLLKLHEQHGMSTLNLTPECKDLEAFAISPVAKFIQHKKGLDGNLKIDEEKEKQHPPVGPQRYAIIPKIISFYKRYNLLEVGTWNGARAVEMVIGALEKNDTVHYTGFDLFDKATDETDVKEFNSKKHTSRSDVEKRLTDFSKSVAKDGKKFTFCLFEGDTKETLKILQNKDYCNIHNIKPDFAYIDGGHSVETCRSDYNYLKHVPVIVFDDFFTTDERGLVPSEDKCGTNVVYNKDIKDDSIKKSIISSKDRVIGGGFTNLALIINDSSLPKSPSFNLNRIPIKVKPHDCMPSEYIQNNITENKTKLKRWIKERAKLHNEHMIVVSGGPSLKTSVNKIKEIQEKHEAKIICVKHALPFLIKKKIVPWACIVLDPRPIDGISTHGVLRKNLFKKIPKKTKFFIASMTDTSVVDHILSKTNNVYGWDAFSQAVKEWEGLKDTMLITGGTCAATRSIGVCHVLGFRNFHLFGFDSSVSEPTDEQKKEVVESKDSEEKPSNKRPKYISVGVGNGNEKFWTTGELLAMAQDMEALLDRNDTIDLELDMYGGGLVQAIWKDRLAKGFGKRNYKEILEQDD